MKLPFKKARRKKKAKWLYKLRNYNAITRAGITANPLEMYNPVSLATVSNNTLVKHNGLDFVGGDTDEYSYDFFTKVAGSNLECPCNYYYTAIDTTLQVATSPNWVLGLNQATIDKFKTPDGTTWDRTTSVNGGIAQALIEVDLTPLCNSAFGGSNSALKSALKSINVDCWAMGSGSNGGILANGVQMQIWNSIAVAWSPTYDSGSPSSVNSSITKINGIITNATNAGSRINTSNKLYILIASQYSSDGVLPSSVSLDYLKVTVQLSRQSDIVSSIPVNLPRYFGVVVKGLSPMWDNTYAIKNSRIFEIVKDSNNKYTLIWDTATKKFTLNKVISGVYTALLSLAPTFNKNQVYNALVGQNSSGMFIYLLKNNGTVEKYTNADIQQLNGLMQLYMLQNSINTQQADAFLDNLTLIDLEKLGKSAGFTDDEAESILRGDDRYYVTSKADFVGKVSGNNVANPHISKYVINANTLLAPNGAWNGEVGNLTYNSVAVQNNDTNNAYTQTTINGMIAQTLFSWDIISHLERKYGTLPCPQDLASKVAWAKANINNITGKWTGYSSANGVNKAYFRVWGGSWYGGWSNVSSTPSLITAILDSNNYIQADGFIHLLAYTDTKGTTTTQIVITAHGLVGGDIVENVTRGNAISFVASSNMTTNSIGTNLITGQTVGDIIKKYHYGNNKTAGAGTNDTTLVLTAHGLSTGDYIKNNNRNGVTRKVTVVDVNTLTLSSAISGQVSGDIIVPFAYVGQQTAETGSDSTIYTDYVSLDITAKIMNVNPYMPNPELFDINKVTLHPNATLNNGVITFNATVNWQDNYCYIPVLPNNRYEIKVTRSGNGKISVDEMYNNLFTKLDSAGIYADTFTFNTAPNTNKIKLRLTNGSSGAGTYTFSNISLKRRD